MPFEITMPQLTDTMTQGTLVKWLKKEGDKVKATEHVADVETDKATMEMESSEAGTVAHIAVSEGAQASVGAVLAVLAVGKENPAEIKQKYANKPVAVASATPALAPKPAPVTADHGGAPHTFEGASVSEIHEPDQVGHGATRQQPTAVPAMPERSGNGHRVFASPLARRIAADKGVDLKQVSGTGPNGRIVQKDVLSFKGQAAIAKATAPAIAPGEKQVIPMTKMRAAIAAALQRSKQNIPHFYESIDIDVEDVSRLREGMNKTLEAENIRLSIADFIYKAVCFALARHPALNARFNPDTNEITRYGDVNMGIAVAVPDGLIVPVLRAVNRMGLKEIRQRSSDLIARARNQKLRREEQTEGTFTISSLGTMGVREFSAIINPPEVAILAVGSAQKRAVVRDGQIVARSMVTLTLSADHRVIDGATAAEFLQTLKAALEQPGMMLV